MNNNGRGITLSDFQNGQTLVTYNDQAGWQTYGTGKTELVEFEYQGEDKSYLSLKGRRSDIARNDTALMAETKAEWTRSQTPEMLAERVFDLCEQYGEQATSNLHVELAMENIDPRLASALEVMARRPEGISFEEYQNTSDYKQLEGLLSNDGYSLDQAFTFQHIDDYEDAWLDVELSEQLHRVINKNPEALEEHYADKPWLREVVDLLEGRPDYTDSLIHRLTDATPEDLDAYERVQSLIRHKDISLDDIKDLSRPEPDVQSGSSLEVQLGR